MAFGGRGFDKVNLPEFCWENFKKEIPSIGSIDPGQKKYVEDERGNGRLKEIAAGATIGGITGKDANTMLA